MVAVFEVYVKIVQLAVAHHAGHHGNFLLGVLDEPPGLDHPVGGQVLGELHPRVPEEDPADVLAGHVQRLRDAGEGLAAAVVALDDEDDLGGDPAELAVLHLEHRVHLRLGQGPLRNGPPEVPDDGPLQKRPQLLGIDGLEEVVPGAGAHGPAGVLEVLPAAHHAEHGLDPRVPHGLGQLVAPVLPQLHVHQGDVGREIHDAVDRLAVRGHGQHAGNIILVPVHQVSDGFADVLIPVNDQ